MIVDKITNTSNNIPMQKTSFKASMPPRFYQYAEKKTIQAEFGIRKLGNLLLQACQKLRNLANCHKISKETFKQELESIKNIDETGQKYMLFVYNFSRIMCGGKEVEINIENNELQDIVESDESCIFIMNHDNQTEDSKLLSFFNALLSREYLYHGKGNSCPRPKIILNKDILESADEQRRMIGEKWGAVGVDASIHCTNHLFNGRVTAKMVQGLAEDKINLFIFPEGRMCMFKSLSPDWKFQSGIADIIRAVAKKKGRVKVIPLGFAYKKGADAIHIGKPLYFKDSGDKMLFLPDNIDKNFSDNAYQNFLNSTKTDNDGYFPILENGISVAPRKSREYISGILCDSLNTCKIKAQESIKYVGSTQDSTTIYTLGELFNERD